MLERLESIDFKIFKLIHLDGQNALFDAFLPYMRDKYMWIPLYLFFIIWCIIKFRNKAWIPVLFTIGAVALSDQLSANLIKGIFERLRPCNTPELQGVIRPLVQCGSGYSFVSAHAANHFTLAVLFTYVFTGENTWKVMNFIFYFWAASICYAQVYVAVHFPFDVLSGAILGLGLGFTFLFFIKRLIHKTTDVPG